MTGPLRGSTGACSCLAKPFVCIVVCEAQEFEPEQQTLKGDSACCWVSLAHAFHCVWANRTWTEPCSLQAEHQ